MALAGAVSLSGCKRHKPTPIVRVWLARTQGCAQTKDDNLVCWGGPSHAPPHVVAKLPGRRALSVGDNDVCAAGDASVRCSREASPGGNTYAGEPIELSAGGLTTCGVDADERVRCWTEGGPFAGVFEPMPGSRVRHVAVGARHTCFAVVTPRREVRCVGEDERGQAARKAPVLVGEEILAIAAGGAHTCARTDRGISCWGANDAGQLGDGTQRDASEPVRVHGLADVVEIGAGARHTCARLASGVVACWGANDAYQLADGTTTSRSRPGNVFGLFGVIQMAVAGDAACALLSDASVRCWGANDAAQLGDGTTTPHNVPSPLKSWLVAPP